MKTIKFSIVMDVDDGLDTVYDLTYLENRILELKKYPEVKNVHEISLSVIEDKEVS